MCPLLYLCCWCGLTGADWTVMRWVMVLSSLPLLLDSIRCSGEPRHSHTLIRPPVTLMDHFFWLIINSLVNNIAPSSAIFRGPPLFFVKSGEVFSTGHWGAAAGLGQTRSQLYFVYPRLVSPSPATSPLIPGPSQRSWLLWLGVTGATQLQLIGI